MNFQAKMLRRFLPILLLISAAGAHAQAQNYPNKPVKLLIPLAAGSAVDVVARIVANKMGETLGQSFVVENEPGAAGLLGMRTGARAAPDGYTILATNDSVITMLPNMRKDAGYDPFKDFVPITQIVGIQWVLAVNPSLPAKSVKELIALAKEKPGTIDYASGGYGSPQHIAGEMFQRAAGIRLTHVPYKGVTPAVTDVVGGHAPMMFTALSTVAPFMADGRIRILAATSPERMPQLPDTPTMQEAGVPGFKFNTWCAMLAPAGTPRPIVDRLNAAAAAALKDPAIRKRLIELGYDVIGDTPEQLGAFMHEEYRRTGDLIRAANIHIE